MATKAAWRNWPQRLTSARPLTMTVFRQVRMARCRMNGLANQGITASAARAASAAAPNFPMPGRAPRARLMSSCQTSPRPSKPLGLNTNIAMTMAKISMSAVLLDSSRLA